MKKYQFWGLFWMLGSIALYLAAVAIGDTVKTIDLPYYCRIGGGLTFVAALLNAGFGSLRDKNS